MLPGPSVIKEFENVLAVHCQKDYVISTCNASVGILGVFWSMGLSNKEIIVTPLTWPGAIAGLLALNCKLKFCPMEPDFLTIDAAEISKLITPETKAVFSTDFLGYPCQLDKIKKICEEYNVLLIHDAASSFGSYYKGYQSGYYADVSIYSFGQKKLFSLGEGGAIVTQSERIYEKLLYGIAHPERQQIEYDVCNPFSLNISMNLLAAEYGLKIFNEQINHIKYRAEAVVEFLKCILQINNQDDIQPNYYKALLTPKDIILLPSDLKAYVSVLPTCILNTELIPQQNKRGEIITTDRMRELTDEFRILDNSFFNQHFNDSLHFK